MAQSTPKPLSISTFVLLFLALVATLFIAIGYYAFTSIESARQDIKQQEYQIAINEFQLSLQTTIETVQSLSEQVSQWDELFQQLENPAYYSYWRNHRLLHTDILPQYISTAEVFDRNGNALATLTDSEFDNRINVMDLPVSVVIEQQQIRATIFLPIRRQDGEKPQGYLGLKFPLIETIKKLSHFRSLENISLKQDTSNQSIDPDSLVSLLNFQLKTSNEAEKLMEIVRQAVIQLATVVGLLCLLFYVLVVVLFGKPLVRISDYIDKLRHVDPGPLMHDTGSFTLLELEKVRESLNQYHLQLKKAQYDLDEKNQELWQLAHHDPLTGVLNRRAFDNEWKASRDLLGEHRLGIGLVLFDINRFKAINDSYGHQTGDEVLKAVSNCIVEVLRKGEKLYRIGGDEFASIFISNSAQEGVILGQRCIDQIDKLDFSELGIKEKVRLSCGISHCTSQEQDKLSTLQGKADIAVYQAKRPGINYPVLFTEEMADGTESLFSSWISDAVYNAVTTGSGVEMHYQPIVDSNSRNVSYHEALLRIRHKDELIPPSHIFPLITQNQLETELDKTVIAKVAEDLHSNLLPPIGGVSVNISAQSIAHRNLIDWLAPLSHHCRSRYIVLEVTETSLITQMSAAVKNLQKLRKQGFRIALDDFGSGYSSLRYLTSMPVDIIKFDISLIHGMADARLGTLVNELARMLLDLDYDLVAEGIEDEETMQRVLQARFAYAQGFLFGRASR